MSTPPLPLVIIVTLNWNRKADTLAFLVSCAGLSYPRLHVIVVDNNSSDGSVAAIGAAFPSVEQITNPANLGFARGMNLGMRHAYAQGADYLFLANNDTTLQPDALDRLVAVAEDQCAGMVAPSIYYYDPPHAIWWLGGWLRPLLLEVRRSDQLLAHQLQQPFAVDFITGCGMLISRSTLETVGFFDERFFMYYEDSDYCLRAYRQKVKVMVEPRALMYHKVAQSSGGSNSPNERYHMARSSVQFFRKHTRIWQCPLIWPYRAGSAVLNLWRLIRDRRLDAARAYLRGLRDGWYL